MSSRALGHRRIKLNAFLYLLMAILNLYIELFALAATGLFGSLEQLTVGLAFVQFYRGHPAKAVMKIEAHPHYCT